MPKLPKERAENAANQESGDFKPLKPGRYVMRLAELEEGVTGEKSKNPGTDKWVWKLTVDKDYHPELRKGRWQTAFQEHVPLTENMDWKMKQLFEGFGYTTDSDTDEILEDPEARIVGYVKTGKDIVTGEPRSEVSRYVTFDPSKFTFSPEETDEDDNQ
ncbi:hypothetical protein SEA_LAZERLEMON_55 [Streptomyces phage LazerLemon]|nr:hypothetical protein SEA_LAZERLEMON_55 [Streptomyces phage LazerLemon]